MTDEQTDEQTDAARLAQIEQRIKDKAEGPHGLIDVKWLLAQLAARTRRLEDTDAALVACERSRDQAKDALAERTRELEQLKDAIAPFRHTPEDADLWEDPESFVRDVRNMRDVQEALTAAEAALAERTRDYEKICEDNRRFDELVKSLDAKYGAAEARLRAVERERNHARDECERLAIKIAEGERALFGPAPTPHGGSQG